VLYVALCCSVLQCVAVCSGEGDVKHQVSRQMSCVAVCCSMLQRVAVCCSVMQCVAVCSCEGDMKHQGSK